MEFQTLTSEQFQRMCPYLIHFFKNQGEKRITYQSLRWLHNQQNTGYELGTIATVALAQKRLAGALVLGRYGIEESLLAVHSTYRNQEIAETLLLQAKEELGKLYGRIECDNSASLKACFNAGLMAFRLIQGTTGKPTLWLAGGDWSEEELDHYLDENSLPL
ncbi:N-acetyltransferase [Mechercharimyces sp. CAU 1602]|uniref:N-acetyltransferase n=1 Tax=Mechercharimyces sp. CAU 1602 TaxID=2973933 RepID=UPI002161767A|nr:N-acetyltransferase [Mechercharimyces sp. CAU 1602]MCS1351635.1 N-acetyltransferase [Mechercharimyces sp. CAU 1602]